MKCRLRIPESLQVLIRHLAPAIKYKVRESLEEIRKHPELGKPLTEDLEGLRSYKVGQIRVVYRLGDPIELVGIGPRKTIYQKVALEIKKNV